MVDYTTLEKLGYSDKDHLTFIESHEISHKILKHKSVQRKTETEADYFNMVKNSDSADTLSPFSIVSINSLLIF